MNRRTPKIEKLLSKSTSQLSGPISRDTAILSLRYPISRDTFSGRLALPKMVRYPPLVLNFTQTHLCDTPVCNVSRDNCAIPPTKTSTKGDTIATSIARYEKYRRWASKLPKDQLLSTAKQDCVTVLRVTWRWISHLVRGLGSRL